MRSVKATWVVGVWLLLLAALVALIDGHRQQHGHASSGTDHRGLHDSKVVQDADHISEHLQELKEAVNVSAMSPEELEFHYFKMHDFDNNTKLDGLEILKALTHLLPYDEDEDEEKKVDMHGKSVDDIAREKRDRELRYYTEIVDSVMSDDDIDDDGYLTYPEYIIARRRAEAQDDLESSSSSSSQSRSSESRHH